MSPAEIAARLVGVRDELVALASHLAHLDARQAYAAGILSCAIDVLARAAAHTHLEAYLEATRRGVTP